MRNRNHLKLVDGRPQPPDHLQTDGRELWNRLVKEYELADDTEAMILLTTAAECLDMMRQAQEAIRRDGLTVKTRYKDSFKEHPAVAIARDARNGMMAALRRMRATISENRP